MRNNHFYEISNVEEDEQAYYHGSKVEWFSSARLSLKTITLIQILTNLPKKNLRPSLSICTMVHTFPGAADNEIKNEFKNTALPTVQSTGLLGSSLRSSDLISQTPTVALGWFS